MVGYPTRLTKRVDLDLVLAWQGVVVMASFWQEGNLALPAQLGRILDAYKRHIPRLENQAR